MRFRIACRGESSCHATRRYLGPEGDLHPHRCDIIVVALKVTVMTPLHFGPAIRMVLTFSFPTETLRARNVLSKRTGQLRALGPSLPQHGKTACNWCELHRTVTYSHADESTYTRACDNADGDVRSASIVKLNFWPEWLR